MMTYDSRFYADLDKTAGSSARRIVPLVLELFTPKSAVDVGCGDGGWLAVLKGAGVEDVMGLDGPWTDRRYLKIPQEYFREVLLDRPIDIDRRFDLAVSLEVAEHLPPERAAGFVADLTALAPVVLFSAAIPYQGGRHHVNEQWPAYWAALFKQHGYTAIDILRQSIWDDPTIAWWYRQNIMLFAGDEALATDEGLTCARAKSPPIPPSLIHPDHYLAKVMEPIRPGLGRWLRMGPVALRRSLSKRAGRAHRSRNLRDDRDPHRSGAR